ncbi:MAG: hypothetical protein AAF699_05895 [Pseudomonadota bacterium]
MPFQSPGTKNFFLMLIIAFCQYSLAQEKMKSGVGAANSAALSEAGTRTPWFALPAKTVEASRKSVTHYSKGIHFGLDLDTKLGFNISSPVEMDRTQDIVDALVSEIEGHTGSLDRYRLEPGPIAQIPEEKTTFDLKLTQRVHGNVVGGVRITYDSLDDEGGHLRATGMLIDPELPELNPDNWISTEVVLETAIPRLAALITDDRDGRWYGRRTPGSEVVIFVDRLPGEIIVIPTLRVYTDWQRAEINLSTGETIRVLSIRPKDLMKGVDAKVTKSDQELCTTRVEA